MILMGDEVRRTQLGNNNAYCHDNELSWFDWKAVDQQQELLRFVRLLIVRRLLRDVEYELDRVSLNTMVGESINSWHGIDLKDPDWSDDSYSVAMRAEFQNEGLDLYCMLNAYWESLDFQLPSLDKGVWRRWIDTSLPSPHDIVPWDESPEVAGSTYRVSDRSVVLLFTVNTR